MHPWASRRSDSEWRQGVLAAAEVEPDQLGRAAADVEHQREIAAEIDQRGTAGDCQLGLRLAADDGDVEPGLGARPLQELVRVGGEPAGLGGDQTGADHLVPPDLGRTHFQRIDRALDGGLRQTAARGDALTEPDDARERVDHLETAPRGARDQQPAVVGAEIERGIGRFGSGGPRRRPFESGAVGGSGLDRRSARGNSRNGVGRT